MQRHTAIEGFVVRCLHLGGHAEAGAVPAANVKGVPRDLFGRWRTVVSAALPERHRGSLISEGLWLTDPPLPSGECASRARAKRHFCVVSVDAPSFSSAGRGQRLGSRQTESGTPSPLSPLWAAYLAGMSTG
jgi:hypothetical protein